MTIEEQLPAQGQVCLWLRLSVEHKERIERAAAEEYKQGRLVGTEYQFKL